MNRVAQPIRIPILFQKIEETLFKDKWKPCTCSLCTQKLTVRSKPILTRKSHLSFLAENLPI